MWIRRKKEITSRTPADEQQVKKYVEALRDPNPDSKVRNLKALTSFASDPVKAEIVAEEIKPIVACLKATEGAVRLEVLGTLRVLAEQGQAVVVAMHSDVLVPALKDDDATVKRKAAAVFRVVAEEGGATLAARHASSIMECFELGRAQGTSLLAPLEALIAIASAGEAEAVAQVVKRLMAPLRDKRAHVRVTGCSVLASIARGGGTHLLGNLGLLQGRGDSETETSFDLVTLFELLVTLALDDPASEVRLAAADTLRCLPEADPDSAEKNGKELLPLVRRVQRLVNMHEGEVKNILSALLGLEEGDDCTICQRGIHFFGGPEKLPCGHQFHAHCIEQWFDWKKKCAHTQTCPLCRWTGDWTPPMTAIQSMRSDA